MGMRCWIYRSTRRDEMYLYLRAEDDFEPVPDTLLARLGRLELVMDLDLYPGRRLARADAATVMESLKSRGYYLQMPPGPEPWPGNGESHTEHGRGQHG